jgi:uncharacterized membrane protein YphA (DoxX/SURF4 family)
MILRPIVAGVWLQQGTWKKVLRRDPHHVDIVASVPGVTARPARALTLALGLFETGLAVCILTGYRRRLVAGVETALLLGMNAGGLAFARDRIHRPRRMLARNAAFLVCLWSLR